MKFLLNIALWCATVLFLQSPAFADQSATLIWNPSPDTNVAGYTISYGTVSQTYTNTVIFGNVTNATITGLVSGTTYYFAASAFDAAGDESPYSNEASYTVPVSTNIVVATTNQPPTLNPISNLTVVENSGTQTVNLSGITSGATNQNQTLTVTAASANTSLIPNPLISYVSPNTNGTLSLTPNLNVTGAAYITVTVNNGGTSNNLMTQSFTVTVASTNAPQIIQPLTNSVAVAGQNIALGIMATGKGSLKYQWALNGVKITSATHASLTLTNVSLNQAGSYSVTVTNNYGSNSSDAALAVYPTLAATLTTPVNSNGQFSFSVAGVPGHIYAVLVSTDLVNWVSMQTNTAPFTYQDNQVNGFTQRFYRANLIQ